MNDDFMKLVAITIQERIKDRIKKNKITPKTIKSGTTLINTARLVNSITHRITANIIYVGTNVKYARIHHEGGIIKPVRAQYLAIPIAKIAKTMSPRDFTDTFIQKGVIYRTKEDGTIEALYSLKKQVRIPARPYMYLDNNDYAFIKDRAVKYLERKFNGL